ncbi:hypothetical protein FQN54_002700 [Arachnomyces sp. PD_36]|nr:hypothetical protein FQN54_002700 [Arachnomyces sp. PD_36]
MALESLPSSDLRRSAMDSKRHHDHKAKWAYGTRSSLPAWYERDTPEQKPISTHLRPAHPDSHRRTQHRQNILVTKGMPVNNKVSFRHDAAEVIQDHLYSDSSADEAVNEPNAAGDEGVFYSFDAPSGPAAGEHLLSEAINKAVERFEVQETKKIEKEYEIIPLEEEHADGYVADDDDFEIVDPIRL